MSQETTPKGRKPYEPPKILMTEHMQGRAVACARASDTECSSGPIQSA